MSEESSNSAPQESSADLEVNSLGVEEVSDIESKGNSAPSLEYSTRLSSFVPICTALYLLGLEKRARPQSKERGMRLMQ